MFIREKLNRENVFDKFVVNCIFYIVHTKGITILRLRIFQHLESDAVYEYFASGHLCWFFQLFTRQCHPGVTIK